LQSSRVFANVPANSAEQGQNKFIYLFIYLPIKVSQAIRFANKRITSNKMSETEQDGKAHSRLGLAIVPLCHGTGASLRRTQAPPGPFEII